MTLASTIRENKAVYTVAGAGDFAVEKIREVPEQVTRARQTVDKVQDRAREAANRYQGEVRGTVGRYREQVRENVTKVQDRVEVKDLPGAAVAYVTHFGTRTVEFIDELAERGKKVVHREAVEVAEITEADAKPGPRSRTAQPQRKPAQPRTTARKTDA
ncbi:hypothetical protein [Actinomadura fibrosa]|uniref:Uncharacterized protein n=1 Tax=Actinomadura fibrosa TaxID=111802 RepID=A0ABW2Y1A6_9ACTN|nr:hypothetical protein [Actinomadura fibrosa]